MKSKPKEEEEEGNKEEEVDTVDLGNHEFLDPLRVLDGDAKAIPFDHEILSEVASHPPTKEWTSFRRLLQQRFPVSKMVSLSSIYTLDGYGAEGAQAEKLFVLLLKWPNLLICH
ncbi:hypothetical protein K1719_002635 [Acacia pycnantha]|nr:hypothetical protein K1719_002635 [Acacia pycnantha]